MESTEQSINEYLSKINNPKNITRKMNKNIVIKELKTMYDFWSRPFPNHIIFTKSPYEAILIANYLMLNDFNTAIANHSAANNHHWVKKAVREAKKLDTSKFQIFKSIFESELVSRLHYYNYFREIQNVKYTDNCNTYLDMIMTIDKYTKWVYTFEEVIIVSVNPISISDNNMVFADGFTDADTKK